MEIRKALDLLHDRMDSDREQRVSDLDEQAGTPLLYLNAEKAGMKEC